MRGERLFRNRGGRRYNGIRRWIRYTSQATEITRGGGGGRGGGQGGGQVQERGVCSANLFAEASPNERRQALRGARCGH